MAETRNDKVIVLQKLDSADNDVRVVFYSLRGGKMILNARGAKKITSKLSAHLEPYNLTELMIIESKHGATIGSAVSRQVFANLKSDWEKLHAAGRVFFWFNKFIKAGEPDRVLFFGLLDCLTILNAIKAPAVYYQWLADIFLFKLLAHLGYQPSLSTCNRCHQPFGQTLVYFSATAGGLVCFYCSRLIGGQAGPDRLVIKSETRAQLALILKTKFVDIIKIAKVRPGIARDLRILLDFWLSSALS